MITNRYPALHCLPGLLRSSSLLLLATAFLLFATSCQPDNPEKARLAELEQQWRETEEAKQPVDPNYILLLARTAEHFASQQVKDDDAPRYSYLAARLYFELGRVDEAERACIRSLQNFPDSPKAADATLMLAQIQHTERGDEQKTINLYEAFLKKWPDHPDARLAKEALTFFREKPENLLPDSLKRMKIQE